MTTEPAPGLHIEGEDTRSYPAGESVLIEATAVLPLKDAGQEAKSHETACWARALYVTCVTADSQVPLVVNLWKDRLIFEDEAEQIAAGDGIAARIPLRVDVANELGEEALAQGRYFVHLSAGPFQSRIISVEVE